MAKRPGLQLPSRASGLGLLLLALTLFGCGHTIRAERMTNHAQDFDFRRFECSSLEDHVPGEQLLLSEPREVAGEEVAVRFLGVAGIVVQWQGVAVLQAPCFSRHSAGRVLFGRGSWDKEAIASGMAALDGLHVAAIIAGHSHHDHMFDLPIVARSHEEANILVNKSGLTLLGQYTELEGRTVDLAILTMASHHLAPGFPELLIEDLRARHVLVTHYDDFFRAADRPLRFVPLLTNRRANSFLKKTAATLNALGGEPLVFLREPCGPAAETWTMPVPGEELRVQLRPARGPL